MPYALSIGVEYDVFRHLNPKKLNAFSEAYKMRMKELDSLVHAWVGNYGISALCVSIANCFNKTSNAKYIKNPIMSDLLNAELNGSKVLTEEEKRKKTENLFMQLKIMGANHKRNKKSKDSTVS